ncbi:MAG: hypothetical protein IJ752_05405 [Alphaproteobacteria bacterium]|nr:hypothetical protein [Alphaproteobacteria bacterium]
MRKIIQDKNYFVFRDSDGVLGFTIKSYEGQQLNPRLLFDENGQLFLLRRPGQIVLLDSLAADFIAVLEKAQRVRFLETPEDSSEIIRQYEVPVTKIESVPLSQDQIVFDDDALWPHSA